VGYLRVGAWLKRGFQLKCLDADLLIAFLEEKQEAYKAVSELEQERKEANSSINALKSITVLTSPR
jgi:predicted transcriptional regulator